MLGSSATRRAAGGDPGAPRGRCRRDEPLRGDFEPPPRAPPVWDYLSPETRRLITEAAAASREAFAEADAKRAAAGEGDAAEDEGYAAEDG